DERGKRTERALAPDVDAAFLRIARRELEDGEHQRDEKAERRDDPDHQRAGPRRGGGRDPSQAEPGDRVVQNEIAKGEDALQSARAGLDAHLSSPAPVWWR